MLCNLSRFWSYYCFNTRIFLLAFVRKNSFIRYCNRVTLRNRWYCNRVVLRSRWYCKRGSFRNRWYCKRGSFRSRWYCKRLVAFRNKHSRVVKWKRSLVWHAFLWQLWGPKTSWGLWPYINRLALGVRFPIQCNFLYCANRHGYLQLHWSNLHAHLQHYSKLSCFGDCGARRCHHHCWRVPVQLNR